MSQKKLGLKDLNKVVDRKSLPPGEGEQPKAEQAVTAQIVEKQIEAPKAAAAGAKPKAKRVSADHRSGSA